MLAYRLALLLLEVYVFKYPLALIFIFLLFFDAYS